MVLTAQPRLRPLTPPVAERLHAVRDSVDVNRLRRHVERLDEPRSRRHASQGMARAKAYVTAELERAGWRVERYGFSAPDAGVAGVNLLADRSTEHQPPPVVVGAHLDTVPASPGADDNASGVACLLELARMLPTLGLDHHVRLAVFDEEETGLHGSRALARDLAVRLRPAAVVVFECVGYYTSAAGTQRLPPGAALLYPGQRRRIRRGKWRGDWTMVAYQQSSVHLARLFSDCLVHLAGPGSVLLARDPCDLAVAGPLLRRYVPLAEHFARSDHKPFWDLGIPAIQVTDSANFRNPHYHQPSDLPTTLDYDRIADIAAATAVAVAVAHLTLT